MQKVNVKVYYSNKTGLFGLWTDKNNDENQFETQPDLSDYEPIMVFIHEI